MDFPFLAALGVMGKRKRDGIMEEGFLLVGFTGGRG